MSEAVRQGMTSSEFVTWAMEQPKGARYELSGGAVVAMAPERFRHALAKGQLYRRLCDAVERAGVHGQVIPDGMAVMVDDDTVYEPDAQMRCGPPMPPDAVLITDPVVVIEVLSPSTGVRDSTEKLENYFRIPSVQHYLIVKPETGAIIHHKRQPDGSLLTRITHAGDIVLDPPGITLTDPHPRPEA